MRREKQASSALRESMKEVGAPQQMFTDNSKAQKSKKWTEVLDYLYIKALWCAPHKQNQNKAERKIQDVKDRTVKTLYQSGAPLVFWCFCMKFVVDCLNHTAKQKLQWRTPMEVMHGTTPDISMFCFHFWEPVEYFEPTAKFPNYKWLSARFVGITWDQGDAFTYHVWTTPDGDHEKGKLLTRDVLQQKGETHDELVLTDSQCEKYESFNLTSKALSEKPNEPKRSKKKRKRIL